MPMGKGHPYSQDRKLLLHSYDIDEFLLDSESDKAVTGSSQNAE